jgi:hypothetical protein
MMLSRPNECLIEAERPSDFSFLPDCFAAGLLDATLWFRLKNPFFFFCSLPLS